MPFVTEPSRAVFLSYASQDTEAAQRIAQALRSAGIEVWLDQSELRGGDVWDHKIRSEIDACALFIPIISRNTQERFEGYFRLEWDLADQRTHRMARSRTFVVPVCVDATPETSAEVPESFHATQWSRLPAGETPPVFIEHVQRLLTGETLSPSHAQSGWSRRLLPAMAAVVIVGALTYVAIKRPWISKPAASTTRAATVTPAAFTPPAHSVAVLPFVNMSGDKEQEYFSDGLTEELLNSLTAINELQVAARISAFSFKGQTTDIATIAHKLNVGSILEGSVRRSGTTIRVTTNLISAVTGFDLWSKTYDRDLGDVLKLQTEIATAVARALKVTLLGDEASKIELGGTANPAAFDAYLRASKTYQTGRDPAKDIPPAVAAYSEAIQLDPHYALAFANRSVALTAYTEEAATGPAIREGFEKAERDARQALTLAPDLAEAHLALADVLQGGTLDFARANQEFERALALAPGNAQVLRVSGDFAAYMGHFDTAIAALRRAVVLDPLNRIIHSSLGRALYAARRYREAATAFAEAIALNPDVKGAYGERGLAFYGLGDLESARASCEAKRDHWVTQLCLAVVYDKLGRHADAEAELKKIQAAMGDGNAYQYMTIYAQWGDRTQALKWLDTSVSLRDPGLNYLKTDPLLDPLRQEPRFQAVMRELKFPE